MKKAVIFSLLGGYILGKAGVEIFGGKTARKVYTGITTGAFLAKDSVMDRVEKIQAGASDIAADARANVEKYYAAKEKEYTEGTDKAAAAQKEED
ncbi:MAG: DUF6110 family protein [Bilifractor sp.]|nr:DUF6110 family protein [Lachnospiraceae bacterium]MDY2836943.1 DUF6110 family protein [Bilifractor sp.]